MKDFRREVPQTRLQKAQELQPSIIVLDVVMPEIDGIAAASVLKKGLPDARPIPYLFVNVILRQSP